MNKTIKLYKERKTLKIINFLLIFFFVESMIIGIMGIKEKKDYSNENLITLSGQVRASYIEDKELYVKLDEYDYHFHFISTDLNPSTDYTELIGKQVSIVCSSRGLDHQPAVIAVSLKINGLEIIDGLEHRLRIGQTLILIGFISAAIFLTVISITTRIKKKRIQVDVNYVEMGIKFLTTLPQHSATEEVKLLYKKRNKAILIYLLGLIIVGFSFYVMYLITGLDDTFDTLVSLAVSIIVFVLNTILLYINCNFILLNKSKYIDEVINRYKKFIDESYSEEVYNDSFGEQGIIVVNDDTQDEIQVPYDKLNISLYVKYTKDPMKMRLFLVTDLDETEYGFLQRDLIVELDGSLKKAIEVHNIEVKGYDYFINHVKEDLNHYINSDKIINYGEKQEKIEP